MRSTPKIGRNDPCPCGSGKKYKKCHFEQSVRSSATDGPRVPRFDPRSLPPEVLQKMLTPPPRPEPHIDFVPSVVHKGYRWRAVWSGVHARPVTETFHEFLTNVVKWTLGEEWWKHQVAMAPDQRHAVVRWASDYGKLTRHHWEAATPEQTETGPVYSAPKSGPAWALLQLGYDLLCLQQTNRLPEQTVAKLTNHGRFQGARFEIAVAAVMMRAGFDIEFLDDVTEKGKHCEFFATRRGSDLKIGVEAKSRVRPGALNEPGTFGYTEDWRGLQELVRRAKKQRPAGRPFFIFLDVNLPTSSVSPPPWIRDTKRVLDVTGPASAEHPDPYNALFLMNFAQNYGDALSPASAPEWGFVISGAPEVALDDGGAAIQAVRTSVARYGHIPDEI